MPHVSSIGRFRSFVFILLAGALCILFSSTPSTVSSLDTIPVAQSTSSSLVMSQPLTIMNYSTLYTTIVADVATVKSTIVLNGASTTLIELPASSIVVKLPENRLAIKYSSEQTSILPTGSTLSYYEKQPIVSVPQQSDVFGVSAVVVSPLENFTATARFDQSIEELDTYEVIVFFSELTQETSADALVSYNIEWGDGSSAAYTTADVTVDHVYSKSGSYAVKINVSDELGFTYSTTRFYAVNYEGHLTHSYLWVKKNKEPVAVTTTASLSLLAIGLIAFTETGKYKLLVLFTLLIPLYTRIQREDVLDQFVRGQIYGYIKTNPGVHYNQIRREVGVKNGTLSYHLGVLEKTELIKSRREGLRYRVFYPTGMMFPKEERFRLTELQIQIIACIKERPGITQREIARLLGQKPQTVNYNIRVLHQANLILVERQGRKTMCYPAREIGTVSSAQ